MLVSREFSLPEVLVKTTYQVVVSSEPSFQTEPIAFGSGFFINYKGGLFFLTADHVIHVRDHDINERTGVDNYVGVLNNISDRKTFTTAITPVSGFYYMESIDVSKKDLDPQLVDIAISLVDRTKFQYPFLTEEHVEVPGVGIVVEPGQEKFQFLESHMEPPSEGDSYHIFGKIRPGIKGVFLERTDTFKHELTFISKAGNYILLNTPEIIEDRHDWAGLSGSPVLNQHSKCIGVLCSVNEGTRSVYVKSFEFIRPLMDMVLLQEKHNS